MGWFDDVRKKAQAAATQKAIESTWGALKRGVSNLADEMLSAAEAHLQEAGPPSDDEVPDPELSVAEQALARARGARPAPVPEPVAPPPPPIDREAMARAELERLKALANGEDEV